MDMTHLELDIHIVGDRDTWKLYLKTETIIGENIIIQTTPMCFIFVPSHEREFCIKFNLARNAQDNQRKL